MSVEAHHCSSVLVHAGVRGKSLVLEPRFPSVYDLADLFGHILLGDKHDLVLKVVVRPSLLEGISPPLVILQAVFHFAEEEPVQVVPSFFLTRFPEVASVVLPA